MKEVNRRLQDKRSSSESGDAGFTLIELLIVIVVLGILAAIVVFALSGVTGKSTTAACQSDAKTVGVGVAALQAENPTQWQTNTSGTWQANLTGNSNSVTNVGAPFLQSWPTGNKASYTIIVAGTGGAAITGTTTKAPNGDVVVKATKSGDTYDATSDPVGSCSVAHLS
jgi:prepilin-type N-terminal cleavage/methylation domain-containing protein